MSCGYIVLFWYVRASSPTSLILARRLQLSSCQSGPNGFGISGGYALKRWYAVVRTRVGGQRSVLSTTISFGT